MTDNPEVYVLAQQINQLQRQMRTLARAAQGPRRSVDVGEGGTTYYGEDGTPLQRTGIQRDGTFGTINIDPSVPSTPNQATVESVIGGIRIMWDGTFVQTNWTSMMSHVEVHVSSEPGFLPTDLTQVAVFNSSHGGEFVYATPNDDSLKYVALVTVSQARVESPKSVEVSGSGLLTDAITLELIDDVIQAQATADGKNTIYYSTAEPTGGTYKVDDIWFDLDNDNAIYRWDGDSWEPTPLGSDAIAPGSIGATELANAINTALSDAQTAADNAQTAADAAGAAAAAAQSDADAAAADAAAAAAAAAAAQGDADNAQTTADGKNTVWYQTGPPAGTDHVVDDIWFDTDNDNAVSRWDGAGWVLEQFGGFAIEDAAITNAKIANATIQSAKIANLDAAKITTGTLDANRIGADSITAFHIATDAITANELKAGAVTTAKIVAGAVTANELAANSVTAVKIVAGTIDATKMVVGTITAASGIIADAAIGTAKIVDGAITTAKIGDAQITTAKIGNLQVTNSLLASGIDAAKITVGILEAGRIAAQSITSDKLSVATFGTEAVANGSFEDGIAVGWTTSGPGTVTTVTGISGGSGSNVLQIARDGTAGSVTVQQATAQYIPVTASASGKWMVKARAKATGALASGFTLRASFFQADKVTPSATASVDIAANVALTVNWQAFAGQFTIPADAKWMRVSVLQATAGSTTHVDEITAQEVVSAVQIADGSIDASKINAQTLTGVTIQTDAAAGVGFKITAAGAIAYSADGLRSSRMEPTGTNAGGFSFYQGATLVGGMGAGYVPASPSTPGIYIRAIDANGKVNMYAPKGVLVSRDSDDPALAWAGFMVDGLNELGSVTRHSLYVSNQESARGYPVYFATSKFAVSSGNLSPDPNIFTDSSQAYIRDPGSGGSFFRATAGRCDATGQFTHSYASINGFISTGLNNTISSGIALGINTSNAICFRVSSGLKHKVDVRPLRSYLEEKGEIHASNGAPYSARASAAAFIGLMDDIPMEEPARGEGRGRIIDIEPIIYKDRHEVEMHMADDPDWTPFPRDWIGWAADDVAEAGWEELVTRDPETGDHDYLHYDRMLPVVVIELLDELNTLRERISSLENGVQNVQRRK
jgi:hypothetical protein